MAKYKIISCVLVLTFGSITFAQDENVETIDLYHPDFHALQCGVHYLLDHEFGGRKQPSHIKSDAFLELAANLVGTDARELKINIREKLLREDPEADFKVEEDVEFVASCKELAGQYDETKGLVW
ncbi:MAG: hypothetical protein GY952_18860 [Rhodobacteraceae bacterium]|nr:hypothetical protein [Paracoccaceae bacterium]